LSSVPSSQREIQLYQFYAARPTNSDEQSINDASIYESTVAKYPPRIIGNYAYV